MAIAASTTRRMLERRKTMLTKQSPEHVALARELDTLSDSVEALNSLVFDQAGLIWCTGVAIYSDEHPILYGQIEVTPIWY